MKTPTNFINELSEEQRVELRQPTPTDVEFQLRNQAAKIWLSGALADGQPPKICPIATQKVFFQLQVSPGYEFLGIGSVYDLIEDAHQGWLNVGIMVSAPQLPQAFAQSREQEKLS